MMTVMQVLPGGQGARTYQDERFSYVVLRRGPRPDSQIVLECTFGRQRLIEPADDVQKAIDAGVLLHPPFQSLHFCAVTTMTSFLLDAVMKITPYLVTAVSAPDLSHLPSACTK